MKLIKVQVTKYKCIEDSNPWKVDQVTCLVGKNEAGKSALLEALYKLNPVEEDAETFNSVEYPRRYALTDEGKRDSQSANVLCTWWTLSESDLELVRSEVPHLVIEDSVIVEVHKGYDNVRRWHVLANEAATVANLIASGRFNAAERASITGDPHTIEDLHRALTAIAEPTPKCVFR